jgi:hypothetical protein
MARLRHAVMSELSQLLDEQRTTFARGELFRVGPKAVISHNASIARLYFGLLFSSAAEQVVLAAA